MTFMALVTFQNSMAVPTNDENRMTIEVSLLIRYRRMTSWQNALMMTLRQAGGGMGGHRSAKKKTQ